jgi:hypothetical protein
VPTIAKRHTQTNLFKYYFKALASILEPIAALQPGLLERVLHNFVYKLAAGFYC